MLLLVFSMKDVVNVELPDRLAEILVILNRMGAYDRPVEEGILLNKVLEFENEHHLPAAAEGDFIETINFGGKYKIVDIIDGEVRLIEKVLGRTLCEQRKMGVHTEKHKSGIDGVTPNL